jgi:hypothetical protein
MTITEHAPTRPRGVCAYARIDEAKVGATGQGAAWLAEETLWFRHAGMLTVTNACIVGGVVFLHAHSLERAQELVDLAIRNGVPANCARAVAQLDKPKAAVS